MKDGARTGAEIMDRMESSVQGMWRPSPGSIYPLLERMVADGSLRSSEDKKYGLTEMGRAEIEQPFPWMGREAPTPRSPESVLELLTSYVSYLEDLGRSNNKSVSANADKIKDLGARLTRIGGAS